MKQNKELILQTIRDLGNQWGYECKLSTIVCASGLGFNVLEYAQEVYEILRELEEDKKVECILSVPGKPEISLWKAV